MCTSRYAQWLPLSTAIELPQLPYLPRTPAPVPMPPTKPPETPGGRHQCHRVAAAHRKLLVGKSFQARSPNGRFKEGERRGCEGPRVRRVARWGAQARA